MPEKNGTLHRQRYHQMNEFYLFTSNIKFIWNSLHIAKDDTSSEHWLLLRCFQGDIGFKKTRWKSILISKKPLTMWESCFHQSSSWNRMRVTFPYILLIRDHKSYNALTLLKRYCESQNAITPLFKVKWESQFHWISD